MHKRNFTQEGIRKSLTSSETSTAIWQIVKVNSWRNLSLWILLNLGRRGDSIFAKINVLLKFRPVELKEIKRMYNVCPVEKTIRSSRGSSKMLKSAKNSNAINWILPLVRSEFKLWCLMFHETITRTRIACKRVPYYMRDSGCRYGVVLKMLKGGIKEYNVPLPR